MRRWSFLLLLLLLSGWVWAEREPEHLVLASWNIENLGGERRQKAIAIAEHLQMCGADILSLQELHVTSTAGPRRNQIFDEVVRILNLRKDADWAYEILPNREANDRARLCGIAWNRARVKKVSEAFRLPIEQPTDLKIWHRHPHAVKFSAGEGKTDLVVIPIHMKSNRSMKGKGRWFGRRQRAAEASALKAALSAVSQHFQGEQDIVLAGDTNCLDAGEQALVTLREAGFRDLNVSDHNTHLGRGAPFDRIFVPARQPEFRFSTEYVLSPATAVTHDEALSDHLLVLTTLKVFQDDD